MPLVRKATTEELRQLQSRMSSAAKAIEFRHDPDGGLHIRIDTPDLVAVLDFLTKVLVAVLAVALLALGGVLIWFMHGASSSGRLAILALGIAFAGSGAVLAIALMLPNVPVVRAVFSGLTALIGAVLPKSQP